jgi:hypothetical protein
LVQIMNSDVNKILHYWLRVQPNLKDDFNCTIWY